MKKLLLHRKFIYWNFIALIFLKVVLGYSGVQVASLLNGVQLFTDKDIVILTNEFRANHNLVDLTESLALTRAANDKLQDMVKGQYFAHYSPSGTSPWYWIEKNKYSFSRAGENLAIGFLDAASAVAAWEESPSHRANLTNPEYLEIGVAVAPAVIGDQEGILVVQLFGSPAPRSPGVAINTATAKTPTPTPLPTITTPIASPTPSTTPTARVSPTPSIGGPLPTEVVVNIASTSHSVGTISYTGSLTKTVRALNSAFIFYALALFLACLGLIVFRQATRELVLKSALYFGLVLVAIMLPILQSFHPALIY